MDFPYGIDDDDWHIRDDDRRVEWDAAPEDEVPLEIPRD